MKLLTHVLEIRGLIQQAIDNTFARLGLMEDEQHSIEALPEEQRSKYRKLADIIQTHQSVLGNDYAAARKEAINECVFTLFNRLAAIKVMEDRQLFPEVVRRRAEHGNLSYAHQQWLEENPEERHAERMGLQHFLESKFRELFEQYKIPLYSEDCPYAVFPTADELDEIINRMNQIEQDADCGADTWKGDDILGWLYENFNTAEKVQLKESGEKTEYDKVSLQSQVYTPRWVVKFLVDNSLGKYYLEMFPDSQFTKDEETGETKYLIANAPKTRVRDPKKLTEIRLIDPACGSGNFLIYAFQVFYDMYVNQIEQYDADYSHRDIPQLIVENNLYGVDLDERAVQLTQTALFIKAMELKGRRGQMPSKTHVVSTHFELPEYADIEMSVDMGDSLWDESQKNTLRSIWGDLRNAYKFGSLVRVKEKFEALKPDFDPTDMFADQRIDELFDFKNQAMTILRNQTANWNAEHGGDYAHSKVNDALEFLDILSTPFDIAVANPPYTDSADFGTELKAFVEDNYKKPYKVNVNLYATFIKRCVELTELDGKVGLIHPMTFMYIKTFEDTRKLILDNLHINLFVEYGLSNLFGTVMVDPAFYVLEKKKEKEDSVFISLDQYTRTPQEKYKKDYCLQALSDIVNGNDNKHVYQLAQSKLKEIKSWPFIYWISDEFREKFAGKTVGDVASVVSGFKTGKNEGALRLWWEVNYSDKWEPYTKGGGFNRWYGNVWLLLNVENNYSYIKSQKTYNIPSKLGIDGITYGADSSKASSFRYLEAGVNYDMKSSSIFSENDYYLLAILNSQLSNYILGCLNPTVTRQATDIKRIPYVEKEVYKKEQKIIELHSHFCVNIKKHLCQFSIIEPLYKGSPIKTTVESSQAIGDFYNRENAMLTLILLSEAIINSTVLNIYELNDHDRQMVLDKEGIPVGDLSVSSVAKEVYEQWLESNTEFPATEELKAHIAGLEINDDQPKIDDFKTLYQNNNGWEEFCIKHKMNPIEVWYQFKQAGILPPQRTQTLAFELITDVIRTVLAKDDDGVIPLGQRLGEDQLSDRIEQEMNERGYSAAQISQIIQLLGMPLEDYLQHRFFQQLSDHLNLFMYLPKTPFIWHITSGEHHALEVYISIYRWSRNTLMRIKSVYAAHAESSYNDRLTAIDTTTAAGQIEAADIKEKLKELRTFVDKIDSLLASGYNPILDDGVGKNIAPLQKAGLLSYDVLNPGQLKKYLNADW